MGLAVAALSLCGPSFGAGTDTRKGDYGPLQADGDYPAAERFFTRIAKDGTTAWRKAAETALRNRGFTDAQAAKFVRLQILPKSKDLPGDYVPGKAGIVKISGLTLPLRFNTETGEALPFDPVAFANALPDCYATDERTCTFKYSGQVYTNDDTNKPCLIPRRTVLFCQKRGFVDKNRFGAAAGSGKASVFAPGCGESDRVNGCGADEVVFDDGSEQTKLTFTVAKAEAATPPATDAGAGATPAIPPAGTASSAPPAPPVSAPGQTVVPAPAASAPRIVYHATGQASFLRREGPKEIEEWEYDIKAYRDLQAKSAKASGPKLDALMAEIKQRFAPPLRYCWPHDVYHPCDLE